MARTEGHKPPADRPRPARQPPLDERPRHPTGHAVILLVGVTVLIVVLAVFSSLGRL